MGLCETGSYDLTIGEVDGPEMPQLRIVTLRALSILTTSASVERGFSIGSLPCAKRQPAMGADTVSARMMVQANWDVASVFVPEVLAVGPRGWAQWHAAYIARRQEYKEPPPELGGELRPHVMRRPVSVVNETDDRFEEMPCRFTSSSDESESASARRPLRVRKKPTMDSLDLLESGV
jgi:hypothetical protein